MNKFQIAGAAQNDMSKKLLLSIPKVKHFVPIPNLEIVAEDSVQKFILRLAKEKKILKKKHTSGGSCTKHILGLHPFPLSQGPVNSPHDSWMEDEQLLDGKYRSEGKKTLAEVMFSRTVFTHDDGQECGEWKPGDDNDKQNITTFTEKLYTVTKAQNPLEGPASSLAHMGIIYTCQLNKCLVHCPCQICCDRQQTCKQLCRTEVCSKCNQQCIQHEIKPLRAFNPETDAYTMVTDKIDSYRFVQPYAGIPAKCTDCSKDVLEHQLYHMVYHLRCRLCKYEARPNLRGSILTIDDYKESVKFINWIDDTTCKVCLKKCSDKKSRQIHEMSIHEKKGKFECEHCDKRYSNITSLNYHRTKHSSAAGKFSCIECGKQFVSETSLSRHVANLHVKSSEAKRIICNNCNKSFTLVASLKRHKKEKHNERGINLDFVEDLVKNVEFECEFCDSKFKREAHRKRHILAVHRRKDDSNFECQQCESRFTRKDNLVKHVRSFHS